MKMQQEKDLQQIAPVFISGYGICSPLNLVDTIMNLCKEY